MLMTPYWLTVIAIFVSYWLGMVVGARRGRRDGARDEALRRMRAAGWDR